ncbi:uncharacterized protein LOC121725395 [Aricia agestis]|uniref:uncharacterized protein LOC121725395 n=1 Tax=Aricia agestis TaxID=91739 RepID=UPI001C206728|nr:uncharacterized protein LOC121725395 [Aricia agestis]
MLEHALLVRAACSCSVVDARTMIARFACLALCACAYARVQPQAQIYVDVSGVPDDVEKRYTPELIEDFRATKADALLLYTEYTGQAGTELKYFLRNISSFANDTKKILDRRLYDSAPEHCRSEFDKRLKKIENDVRRAASFSAENHHKFLLAHMLVFRIHLNKSEEFINKCEKVYKTCGIPCETQPKMIRWRRCAMNELNRVKDDIIHSRRSYKDLLLHSRRRLRHFHKVAKEKANLVSHTLEECTRRG